MAIEFSRFKDGGQGDLISEQRLNAVSGYAMYVGQALKVSGGALIYAQSSDIVYAISNVSAASSVVTASYKPEVFPVNDNQVWKASIGSAITAAFVPGSYAGFATSVELGTSIAGDVVNNSAMYVFNIATASTPSTSAAYVIFPNPVSRA